MMLRKQALLLLTLTVLVVTLFLLPLPRPAPAQTQNTCQGQFISISEPLTDLGDEEYVRLNEGPTGFTGGLYPNGQDSRPPAHEAAGLVAAAQIEPLNQAGVPAADGRIVMISVGMSNAAMEFRGFVNRARNDPRRNEAVRIINGAQPGWVTSFWLDPEADAWDYVDQQIIDFGLTPAQVQVAWVKNVRTGAGDFPEKAELLQGDLETIVRNLKIRYPNIKIAYLSSRTRSYTYEIGLSPEPAAFETGFAVKWLIEQQIEGDPALNYDPQRGPVVAPYLSWGPYLWIDGLNERSDGRVWLPEDMVPDCTHPSDAGVAKVAEQLLQFFQNDSTARGWYLAESGPLPTPVPTPVATPTVAPTPVDRVYLPSVNGDDRPVPASALHCSGMH